MDVTTVPIRKIRFFLDSNGSGLLDGDDLLIGEDNDGTDGWGVYRRAKANWPLGYMRVFAQAVGTDGSRAAPAETMVQFHDGLGRVAPVLLDGDFDGDGRCTPADLTGFVEAWGQGADRADVASPPRRGSGPDGDVTIDDLHAFLTAWAGCGGREPASACR